MAIKHGAIADPTGMILTGCLLHELKTRVEDVAVEVNDNQGAFAAGKSLRVKTNLGMTGECLSTVALPDVGSGAATSTSPRVSATELTEKSEGAADFAVDAHYYAAGEGDYA